MKLRIKETGELLEDVKFIDTTLHKITIQYLDDGVLRECSIKNLSDIEEVKDCEEPKEHYFITEYGGVYSLAEYEGLNNVANVEDYKQIGNYFNTREEAEKAVEKLKAYKRLKDKGFRFKCCDDYHIDYELAGRCAWTDETEKDLDLLFGGEDE